MRPCVVGASLWLLLCGVAHAAPGGQGPVTATVAAGQGQPTHMPTYRGPAGVSVPVGACAAIVDHRVWVLPCSDPRVTAYQHAAKAAAARATREAHQAEAVGGLGVAAVAGAVAGWSRRRRTVPVRGV